MPQAHRIQLLSDAVANKIAAGEVVERPASVLKELLENAFDAGATRIEVEITAGGRKLVSVSDNGVGMDRENALLAIESHATSKIRDVDDIESIDTMGFRGEALAAIVSVSRFRLVTCAKGDVGGTELLAAAGKIHDVQDVGAPQGTTIEVRDLFFNVPARKKFLRTYQTEAGHLRSCFIMEALAHPDIGMSLTIDGHRVHQLASDGTIDDRIRDLFGKHYFANLHPFSHHVGSFSVSGFLSKPGFSRADRNDQYIFVNGRPTSAAVISYAIREGFRGVLPKDRHPSVFIRMDMNPGDVDVNVHPTKREVRFRRGSDVRDGLLAAIREALTSGTALPALNEPATAPDGPVAPPRREEQMTIENLPRAEAFRYPRLPAPEAQRPPPGPAPPVQVDGDAEPQEPEADATSGNAPWTWCRVLGLVGGVYVVLETDDGFILMDPRGAHERVLFERFMRQVRKGTVQGQSLLIPENVELGPKHAACIRQHHDLLRASGFGVSEFGGNAFVVDALPACFANASAGTVLPEMAAELMDSASRGNSGPWREESIARASSRAAVRQRERLKLEEIEALVKDLAQAEMPYTCPHGRPTLIFTSFRELNRRFGKS